MIDNKFHFDFQDKKYFYTVSSFGSSIGYEIFMGSGECYNEIFCNLNFNIDKENEAKIAVAAYNIGLRDGRIRGNNEKILEIKKALKI